MKPVTLRFLKGPIALRDGSVLVVEIQGGTLTRVLPGGGKAVVAELTARLTAPGAESEIAGPVATEARSAG